MVLFVWFFADPLIVRLPSGPRKGVGEGTRGSVAIPGHGLQPMSQGHPLQFVEMERCLEGRQREGP